MVNWIHNTRHALGTWIAGKRPPRLREQAHGASPLSYLLFLASSVATVLTLGHSQIPLLMGRDIVVRIIAGLSLGLLVTSVYAADMCMLATLARVPVLARNRSHVALIEHALYVAFVLGIEITTYGLVMAVLDTNPHALLSAAPLVPLTGPVFLAQIAARAVLLGWTGLQLFIVRRPLPPVPATLVTRAQELIGGDALARMAHLSTAGLSVADATNAYLILCRRPRRVRSWWNEWLVRRDMDREQEEDRQRGAIVDALAQLEGYGGDGGLYLPTGPGTPLMALTTGTSRQDEQAADLAPTIAPVSITRQPARRVAASVASRSPSVRRQRVTAAKKATRTPEQIEDEIRLLLAEDSRMGLNEIVRRVHVNIKTAADCRARILAEYGEVAQ